MKDIQDTLARVCDCLAEIAQVVVNAMDNLTPEQRAVIEFLAENPKVAEGLQELTIGGATKETTQPKEPLIKDERTRKVIRAWAEVNSVEEVLYAERTDKSLFVLTDMGGDDTSIMFVGWVPTLKDGADYTIAELCGEEETPKPLEPTFIDLDERIREKEEE